MKFSLPFLAAALLSSPSFAQSQAAPAAAPATAAPQISAGATVVGPSDGEVGTIASVGPDYAIVKTDRHEVRLPKTSFGSHPKGLVIGLSRDALNASVDDAMAKLNDMLKPGSTVYGTAGGTIGTVDAADAELVTVKLASGKMVRLPRTGFGPGPQGVMVGFTVDQLEAQASAAGAK